MDIEDIIKQIEHICDIGISNEEILQFISKEELFDTNTDSEIAKHFLNKTKEWKKWYYIKSETIRLYGILTWYFNISISEIYNLEEEWNNIHTFFIKLWLAQYYTETEMIDFQEEDDYTWIDRLKAEAFESLEFHQCCQLSVKDFIKDLEEYYHTSLNRFECEYKKSTRRNSNMVEKMELAYSNYQKYLTYFGENFKDYKIIRINKLGELIEEKYFTEMSWYFLFGKDKIYFVILSDFA